MIETDTRLRVARGIAKTETKASTKVFETLKRRGHPDCIVFYRLGAVPEVGREKDQHPRPRFDPLFGRTRRLRRK